MKFGKLGIQNFLSIQSAEIDLSNQGLILIQGKNTDDPAFESNGAGKSSIMEALSNVLFDRTVRGLKGDEIVNNFVGKNCFQYLELQDENNVPYRIERYRKHKEHKNNVYVFRDGENITPKSAKDTNKFIEQLIQMDYETFTNSILFGQGLIKMFSVASDGDKKAILEKMLNITVFKESQDVAKERLQEKENEIKTLDSNTEKTENLIDEVKGTVTSLKESEKEHTINTNKEIERLTGELESWEKRQKEEDTDHVNLEDKAERLKGLKDRVEVGLSKYKEYEDALNSVKNEIQFLLMDKKRNEKSLTDLGDEAKKISAGKGTSCPVCSQEITKETTESALQHILAKMVAVKADIQKSISELEGKKDELKAVTEKLQGKEKLKEQKDVIIGELSEVNASIRTRDRNKEDTNSRISELKSSIERFKKDLEKTYKPMIEEKEKQLVNLKTELKTLKEKRKEIASEVDLVEFWVKSFGNTGIKSYLLDSVTPFLNKKANYYLSKLAGNTTEIEFSTQTRLKSGEVRDKFEIRINNLVGGTSYTSNSMGERRRIDLAISLALQDLVMSRSNGKINFRMYDEVFDSLDAVGCENAIQLLQELQQEVESILVITHNDVLKTYFDNYLTVTKAGGMTTILKEG